MMTKVVDAAQMGSKEGLPLLVPRKGGHGLVALRFDEGGNASFLAP
jgi:hypothetical protein